MDSTRIVLDCSPCAVAIILQGSVNDRATQGLHHLTSGQAGGFVSLCFDSGQSLYHRFPSPLSKWRSHCVHLQRWCPNRLALRTSSLLDQLAGKSLYNVCYAQVPSCWDVIWKIHQGARLLSQLYRWLLVRGRREPTKVCTRSESYFAQYFQTYRGSWFRHLSCIQSSAKGTYFETWHWAQKLCYHSKECPTAGLPCSDRKWHLCGQTGIWTAHSFN